MNMFSLGLTTIPVTSRQISQIHRLIGNKIVQVRKHEGLIYWEMFI